MNLFSSLWYGHLHHHPDHLELMAHIKISEFYFNLNKNKLFDQDNNNKTENHIIDPASIFFWSVENNKFPFLMISDNSRYHRTVQLTLVLQSKNIFILPEILTLLPQATPHIHFKETIMRKICNCALWLLCALWETKYLPYNNNCWHHLQFVWANILSCYLTTLFEKVL